MEVTSETPEMVRGLSSCLTLRTPAEPRCGVLGVLWNLELSLPITGHLHAAATAQDWWGNSTFRAGHSRPTDVTCDHVSCFGQCNLSDSATCHAGA